MEKQRTLSKSIIILGLFSFITSLSGESTNLALPTISRALSVTNNEATWIVQIGLITTTILLVAFGRLGDQLSKEFIFLVGGILFTVGSLINGLAPDFVILLFGRIIQAIGSAMIMANSIGLTTEYSTPATRGTALAIISMFISVGAISGPALGGVLLSALSWRWIYLINVPLGLLFSFMGYQVFTFPKLTKQKIEAPLKEANWLGQGIFSIGIIILSLSSLFFQSAGARYLAGSLAFLIGAGLTVYSFIQDDHSKYPWISPRVLRNKRFMLSMFALFLAMLTNVASNILLPFYLQSFNKIDPLISGLVMVLQSVVMLIIAPVAGRLSDKIGSSKLILTGISVLILSQLGYTFYPLHFNWFLVLLPILLNGVGMGIFLSPNNSLAMSFVDKENTGVAGSLTSFFRTIGMSLGISIASAVLFAQLPNVRYITPALGNQFIQAFHNVFWVMTFLAVVCLVLSIYAISNDRKKASRS